MTAATLQETIVSAGVSQDFYVGPNSKLIGGLVSAGSNGAATARVELFALGQWITITSPIDVDNQLFNFNSIHDLFGQIPAGSRVRVNCTGTFQNATIFLMTS